MSIGKTIKHLSHAVSTIHNERGFTAFMLDGTPAKVVQEEVPGLDLLTVTDEGEEGRVAGPTIYPKDVRRFLFNWRNDRRSTREGAVLVTAFDKDRNVSFIGLAALVRKEVADRMIKRKPLLAVLEV